MRSAFRPSGHFALASAHSARAWRSTGWYSMRSSPCARGKDSAGVAYLPTPLAVEAFPWNTAPAYLVRDNDGAYGQAFRRRVRAMGIRDRPISPRSPWQNPYAERLIGATA